MEKNTSRDLSSKWGKENHGKHTSGQISNIPKPDTELREFGGDSLTQLSFKVTKRQFGRCNLQEQYIIYP